MVDNWLLLWGGFDLPLLVLHITLSTDTCALQRQQLVRVELLRDRYEMQEDWHILLVEDEENLRGMLTEMLQIDGFQVADVVDGQSALDWLEREGSPHLAVVDINLPDMDGLKVAEILYAGRGVPVIVITGYDAA